MKRSIFSICMLFITAVIVSPGQSEELDGIVGQSVTFTAPVKNEGSLKYEDGVIGDVTNGNFTRFAKEKSRDRLQWDGSTGLFSLSELEVEDSGKYEVLDTMPDDHIKTVFKLNMYKDNVPVSKPNVSVTSNEYPCKLMCTVERGTGVTLSWYREGEKKNIGSSYFRIGPPFNISQTVDKGTHTCEAKNSVSTNTSDPITVGDHCTAPSGPNTWMIVAIVFIIFCVILIAVLLWRKIKTPKRAGQPNGEVQPNEQAPLNAANGNGTK